MPDMEAPDIGELPANYTRCRTIGHAWFEADSDWAPDNKAGTPITLRCERCGTERRETWGRHNGLLLTRYYVHPDGYLQKWGGNFPTRDDFRLALLAIKLREAKPRNGRSKAS